MSIYYEFTGLLLLAAFAGAVAVRLRQPLLVAFIATGIIAGPAVLGWVETSDPIELLAELGITVLLFVVGLKLDLRLVRNLGPVALATGLGQIVFTTVFGFALALALGIPPLTALYVAVALTFSSTIIIVKLLSDKREIDSLHGRIAMGFLIVQDIAVALAMMVLSVLGAGLAPAADNGLLWLPLKLAAVVIGILLLMRYVLPRVLHLLARSGELLLIVAVAWGAVLATLGDMLGFSKEVGALLAGFSLASTPYREAISTRLTSLRDFLLLFFFIELGAQLDFATIGDQVPAALILSLFVLIGNPLIVMAIMGYMGYRRHTGFLAGLTVAQISEFSFVFIALGVSLGQVLPEAVGLVTLVGLITITLSTYMILYSQHLYRWLDPWLGIFERRRPQREAGEGGHVLPGERPVDIIIYGLGRYGWLLADDLQGKGFQVLGVDFDPELVRRFRRLGINVRFGDAEDPDYPETLPLHEARWVVSTLASTEVNLALLEALRRWGFQGMTVLTAHTEGDARRLRAAGADRVLLPFRDAAAFAAEIVSSQDGLEGGKVPADYLSDHG